MIYHICHQLKKLNVTLNGQPQVYNNDFTQILVKTSFKLLFNVTFNYCMANQF